MVCIKSQSRSSLGRALPSSIISGEEILIAMKAFCDGSGTLDSKALVLAGVAAEDSVWTDFESDWSRILKARSPIAPYLHMADLASGRGPFVDEQGWDDDKRQQLITDCVMYSQTLDKKTFRTFICSVDMVKHRELKEDAELVPSALAICNYWVPKKIFDWFLENQDKWAALELHYFFDQNERFKGLFEKQVQRGKKSSRLSNAWHIIRQVTSVDSRLYPPLQLADLLAWAHYRRLTASDPNTKWVNLHVFTNAILPSSRIDITAKGLEALACRGRLFPDEPEYPE